MSTPNDPKNNGPDDMRFDVRMSTPQERAESGKKPPKPNKGKPKSGDVPPTHCVMSTAKPTLLTPDGSNPPSKNKPHRTRNDSSIPIPRILIAIALFVWAAAFIYPAWDISRGADMSYSASRSFFWNPPSSPRNGSPGLRYSNPEINPLRTAIPAFSFTVAAVGISLLCKKPGN